MNKLMFFLPLITTGVLIAYAGHAMQVPIIIASGCTIGGISLVGAVFSSFDR